MLARLSSNSFRAGVLLRVGSFLGALWGGSPSCLIAKDFVLGDLPVAGQTGPSCGFFANVPAVSLATGFDIYESRPFLQSIYGLRRGDFRYQRSFDKRMFFELFALPYEVVEVEHPPLRADLLKPKIMELIRESFDPGLAKGDAYSLRVIGVFGGPHNALLLERQGDSYLVHDPYPGRLKKLTRAQLADFMMVRSTAKQNRGKEVYVTHYLAIDLPPRSFEQLQPIHALPSALKSSLSADQRRKVAACLEKAVPGAEVDDLAGRIASYPKLDFAALPGKAGDDAFRNVIGADLSADELGGVLNLCKFTLNTWHLKRRPLLPVVFMNQRPWVLVQYLKADPEHPEQATLVFDDGRELMWLSPMQALKLIRADGACYATVGLAYE